MVENDVLAGSTIISVSFELPTNALAILVTVLGIVILVSPEPENTMLPILVTPSGIVILVSPELPINEWSPI